MNAATQTGSRRSSLKYEPRDLEFGTSGRRGKVVDLTQLEVYINALAELEYLQSLDTSEGGIVRGQEFFFARDLRPSSDSFVPELEGRGEIAQANRGCNPGRWNARGQPWLDTDSRADMLCAGARQRQHHGDRQPHSIRFAHVSPVGAAILAAAGIAVMAIACFAETRGKLRQAKLSSPYHYLISVENDLDLRVV